MRFAGLRPAGVAPFGIVSGGPGTSDPTRIRYHDVVRDAPAGKDRFPEVPEGYAGMAIRLQDGRAYLIGVGQSISDLLGWSPFRYDHVVDKTGLAGKYDFRLVYRQPGNGSPADNSVPDLFGALEKQLGLKARPAEVSIDVLVIDRAKEMPTGN